MSDENPELNPLQKWREENPDAEIERKTPWDRIRENPKSMRYRVNGFCYNCVGWEVDGERPPGIIENIRGCTALKCPLWDIRPYRDPNVEPRF